MDAASSQAAAIEASALAVGYAGPQSGRVLSGVDLQIDKGEFLTILGPSGCGKSTLLRVIADLLPPLDGRLSVLGRSPSQARRRREVDRRLRGAFNVFCDPPSAASRRALSRAIKASRPLCTTAVFSERPLRRVASAINRSSMLSVVLICISMPV